MSSPERSESRYSVDNFAETFGQLIVIGANTGDIKAFTRVNKQVLKLTSQNKPSFEPLRLRNKRVVQHQSLLNLEIIIIIIKVLKNAFYI